MTDLNYSSSDLCIFSETRLSHSEIDNDFSLDGYSLFRSDGTSTTNVRPFGGTAIYSRIDYYPGYPYFFTSNGIEITIMRFMIPPHVTIIGIY